MIQKKNQRSLQLAESVHDDFWGPGLNKVGTEHTDHRKIALLEYTGTDL